MKLFARTVRCCEVILLMLSTFSVAVAQQPIVLGEHSGAVMAAGFVGDAERAVTVGSDQRVHFWDVPGSKVLQTYSQHTGPIYTLAVSADGQTLATGAQDNSLRIWDLPRRLPIRRHTEPGPAIRSLALAPDTFSILTTATAGAVRSFPLTPSAPPLTRTGHAADVIAAAWRADNSGFATADAAGVIQLWSPDLEQPLGTLIGHPGRISHLLFAQGNQQLLSVGDDQLLRVWQLPAPPSRLLFTLDAAAQLCELIPGQNLVLCTAAGQSPLLINLQTGERTREFPAAGNDNSSLAPAPNAQWFAAGSSTGEIRILNTGDASLLGKLAGHTGAITDLAVHADNQRLLSAGADGTVRLWKLPVASKPLQGHAAVIRGITSPASGTWTATWSEDKTLRFRDAAGNPVGQPATHQQPVTCAAPRHDAALLASGDAGGVVSLWNTSSGALEGLLPAHQGAVHSVEFSPNGTQLATAGADGIVRFWKLPFPKQLPAAEADRVKPDLELPSPDADPIVHLQRLAGENGLAAITASGSRLHRINWNAQLVGTAPSPGGVLRGLASGKNGELFAAWAENGALHILGPDLALQRSLPAIQGIRSARWNREATTLLVADAQPRIRIIAADTGRLLEEISTPAPCHSAEWTAADQSAITAAGDTSPEAQLLTRSLLAWQDSGAAGPLQLAPATDPSQVWIAGAAGEVQLRPITGGEPVRSLNTGSPIVSLALAGNGSVVAAARSDNLLSLWKADGTALPEIRPLAPPRSLALNADGTRLAVASVDGLVRTYETASATILETHADHTAGSPVVAVRFISDNLTLLSAGEDRQIRLHKNAITRAQRLANEPLAAALPVGAGAQYLIVTTAGAVQLINATSGAVERTWKTDGHPARSIAVRPDNQRIAAGLESGEVRIWNINDAEKPLQVLNTERTVEQLHWSPDNRRLAAATGEQITIFGPPIPNTQPAVELIVHQTISCEAPVAALQFSPDARRLFTALANGRLDEWTCAGPEQRRQFTHNGAVYGTAVSKDGNLIVSCSADQTVRVWDNVAGQQKFSLAGHRGPVHAVALSPDESFVVSSGADGTLRLWDIVGGRQLKQLAAWETTMYSVAIHPAGNLIAAAGADRRIHLLDIITGSEVRTLEGHTDYIHSVAFSPDGNQVLSYGYAGQLKSWNTADGTLASQQQIGRIGNTARYSPDGRSIILAAGDGSTTILPTPAPAP
jgi:WD40 repeat protein